MIVRLNKYKADVCHTIFANMESDVGLEVKKYSCGTYSYKLRIRSSVFERVGDIGIFDDIQAKNTESVDSIVEEFVHRFCTGRCYYGYENNIKEYTGDKYKEELLCYSDRSR